MKIADYLYRCTYNIGNIEQHLFDPSCRVERIGISEFRTFRIFPRVDKRIRDNDFPFIGRQQFESEMPQAGGACGLASF